MEPTQQQELDSFVGKFVGPRKVQTVVTADMLTVGKNPVVRVTYDGDFFEIMPLATLVLVATISETDFNELRRKKFMFMLPKLMEIVAETDIKVYEVDALFRDAANSLTQSFNRALNFVWNHDDTKFVPGVDPVNEFTFVEAQAILSSIPERVEMPIEAPVEDAGAAEESAA